MECSRHAMLNVAHDLEGTHRLEEPVSKRTLKFCAGVPIEMGPARWGTEIGIEIGSR